MLTAAATGFMPALLLSLYPNPERPPSTLDRLTQIKRFKLTTTIAYQVRQEFACKPKVVSDLVIGETAGWLVEP